MHHYTILLCILCGFLWSLCITIEKFYLLKKFTAYQLMFLRHIWFALFSLILVLTLDGDFSFMNKITKKDLGMLILAVFLNVITLVIFFTLLSSNKTGYTISITHPVFIISSTMIAYLFFNESLNWKQMMGIPFIVLGIVILKSFKK